MVAHLPPERVPPEGNANPNDELGPELREAVEAVLHDEPSADWAEATLEELRRGSPRTAPRRLRRFAVWTTLAAAACVLAFVLLRVSWLFHDGREVGGDPRERREETPVLARSDLAEPTLWAYQQAARQSPEALDELLDRHAGQLLHPSSDDEPATVWQDLL
ncbi:MAG: hypothetical protein ACYTG0_23665 [Planctomycetota bacterium]|jgi:hypothetical protein